MTGSLEPDSLDTESNFSCWKCWGYGEAGWGGSECVILAVHHRKSQDSLSLCTAEVSLEGMLVSFHESLSHWKGPVWLAQDRPALISEVKICLWKEFLSDLALHRHPYLAQV